MVLAIPACARIEISVAVFVNSDDERKIQSLVKLVDDLTEAMGFDGSFDVEIERGSYFRPILRPWRKCFSTQRIWTDGS